MNRRQEVIMSRLLNGGWELRHGADFISCVTGVSSLEAAKQATFMGKVNRTIIVRDKAQA